MYILHTDLAWSHSVAATRATAAGWRVTSSATAASLLQQRQPSSRSAWDESWLRDCHVSSSRRTPASPPCLATWPDTCRLLMHTCSACSSVAGPHCGDCRHAPSCTPIMRFRQLSSSCVDIIDIINIYYIKEIYLVTCLTLATSPRTAQLSGARSSLSQCAVTQSRCCSSSVLYVLAGHGG